MKNCYLRAATENDARLLYNWRCDESVRLSAFCNTHFSFESHLEWLKKTLSDNNAKIYILVSCDTAVGQVRVNRIKNKGIIDYSIDENYRGKGFGKKIIELLQAVMTETAFVNELVAEVKKTNIASCHIFESLNFIKSDTEKFFSYTKNLCHKRSSS